MAACLKNRERTCVVQILGENIPLEDQQKVSIYKKNPLQFQGKAYQFLYFLQGKQKMHGLFVAVKMKMLISVDSLYSKCTLVFSCLLELELIFFANHTKFSTRVKTLIETIVFRTKGDGLLLFLR